MTREERMQAFTMRLDGCAWDEIGRALGYTPQAVQEDLAECLSRTRERLMDCNVIYPAVKAVIITRCNGSVSEFARRMGHSESTVRKAMSGERPMQAYLAADIAGFTGLPISEVLRKC